MQNAHTFSDLRRHLIKVVSPDEFYIFWGIRWWGGGGWWFSGWIKWDSIIRDFKPPSEGSAAARLFTCRPPSTWRRGEGGGGWIYYAIEINMKLQWQANYSLNGDELIAQGDNPSEIRDPLGDLQMISMKRRKSPQVLRFIKGRRWLGGGREDWKVSLFNLFPF